MTRKYLPVTIAKNHKYEYVKHLTGDFETTSTEDRKDVRVWAWGLADISTYEFEHGRTIDEFLDRILSDTNTYDIAFHNLKFDGQFILPALYRRGYTMISNSVFNEKWADGEDLTKTFTHNITAQGQWFNITIIKDQQSTPNTPAFVNIWDSLKLFPQTLKEVGKQYCTKYQKIDEPKEFYTMIRPENHVPTSEELHYLKNDCLVLAEALTSEFKRYKTIYRTRASKAFDFFKQNCLTEDGKTNTYQNHYVGLQQYYIPEIEGLEDWAGSYYRFAPKEIRERVKKSKAKLIKTMEYFIPDYQTWEKFKQAYRGGISYVNPLIKEKDIIGNITTLDVNSMYPYVLRNKQIPFGRCIKHKGKPVSTDTTTWIACARVSFKLKKSYNLPCIQIKQLYGREWLAESTDYRDYGEMDYYNDDVIWFTRVDYETYLENYDFVVHEWVEWYEFKQMSNADGKRFIDKYYKQKQKADSELKKIREKHNNDKGLYEKDEDYKKWQLERQEAKIIMNSAYGKHGTKYILLSKITEYIDEETPVKFIPEKHNFNKEPDDPSHYYIPYAAFVTAYARQMLVRAWNSFEGKALYCDTDSLHFSGTTDDIPASLHDLVDWEGTGALGLWKIEGKFIAGRYIRAKTYIEVTEKDELNIVCAGATPEVKELMNWNNFKTGFNAWEICAKTGKDHTYHCKLKPKQYPSGVGLEPQNYEIRK